MKILRPVEIPLDLNGRHHEIGTGHGGIEIRGCIDLAAPPQSLDYRLGVAQHRRQTVGADIHQNYLKVTLAERITQQDIADGCRPKLTASGPDKYDFKLHSWPKS